MWSISSGLCLLLFYTFDASAQNECTTPNGDRAQCLSVYSCQKLLEVVRSKDPLQIQFLRESQCGFQSAPLVCCGRYNHYVRGSSSSTQTGSQTASQAGAGNRNSKLPERSNCGRQTADKILGGQATAPDEFPWMALLQYRKKTGDTPFACGGSLISRRYVLTAAHCVTGRILTVVGRLYSVRLGEWDTDTDRDCQRQFNIESCNDSPIDVQVERAIPHSRYSDTDQNRYNDIALVKLRNNVPLSNFISPICLPTHNERSPTGAQLFVAGWGRTEYSSSSSKKLKLKVPIAEPRQCSNRFRSANVSLIEKQLCAGGQAGKDSCTGDSGGPLMATFSNDTSQWYIEGIVSFGAKCGTEGWPGIYTRVSEYIDWISENID